MSTTKHAELKDETIRRIDLRLPESVYEAVREMAVEERVSINYKLLSLIRDQQQVADRVAQIDRV